MAYYKCPSCHMIFVDPGKRCPHCAYCTICSGSCRTKCPVGLKALEVSGMTEVASLRLLVDMTERLFSDEDKDITFELIDGQEKAHKGILKAASDVWNSMLNADMKEKNGIIVIQDVRRVSMRVLLRLIYTAHVNPSDWEEITQAASGDGTAQPDNQKMPLDILIDVATLSKRYMINSTLSMATQVLKTRLKEAIMPANVETFQHIMAGAIKHDLGTVRMAALELAKPFTELQAAYKSKSLLPEVLCELEAIWATPDPIKRPRLQ